MKKKLTYTKQYLLLIDEKAEIKEGDYFLLKKHIVGKGTEFEMEVEEDIFCRNISKSNPELFLKDGFMNGVKNKQQYNCFIQECQKILAYLPLTPEAAKLDLPLLPPLEEDVFKLSDEFYKNHQGRPYAMEKAAWREGYKAAQSKQFTLEDMHKAIDMARKGRTCIGGSSTDTVDDGEADDCVDWNYTSDQIIQSLRPLPKEFIPEYYTNGDMIVKNRNGVRELMGTYKY